MSHIITQFLSIERAQTWHSLFALLARDSALIYSRQTFNEAKIEKNRILNRYEDVLPFDNTLVQLRLPNSNKQYINANLVKFEAAKSCYILTQGPLCNTVSHFWKMVWQENSNAVIMLNKLVEKGRAKCFRYFPVECSVESIIIDGATDELHADVLKLQDVELNVELLSEVHYKSFVKRNLKITNTGTGETRSLRHYNYVDWPDFGEPSCPLAFLRFLSLLRSEHVLDDGSCPIIHCSAGIGRSGTFVFVDTILKLLASNDYDLVCSIDSFEVLQSLRSQRIGLIQTPEQLRFSYLTIIQAFGDKSFKINSRVFSDLVNYLSAQCDNVKSNECSWASNRIVQRFDITRGCDNHLNSPCAPTMDIVQQPDKHRNHSLTGSSDDSLTGSTNQHNPSEMFDNLSSSLSKGDAFVTSNPVNINVPHDDGLLDPPTSSLYVRQHGHVSSNGGGNVDNGTSMSSGGDNNDDAQFVVSRVSKYSNSIIEISDLERFASFDSACSGTKLSPVNLANIRSPDSSASSASESYYNKRFGIQIDRDICAVMDHMLQRCEALYHFCITVNPYLNLSITVAGLDVVDLKFAKSQLSSLTTSKPIIQVSSQSSQCSSSSSRDDISDNQNENPYPSVYAPPLDSFSRNNKDRHRSSAFNSSPSSSSSDEMSNWPPSDYLISDDDNEHSDSSSHSHSDNLNVSSSSDEGHNPTVP